MRHEQRFRGISMRLARHYFENLGGEQRDEHTVVGEGWRVDLSEEKVSVGPSLQLNEVTVVFEGDEEALEELIEDFEQKAMRAGG